MADFARKTLRIEESLNEALKLLGERRGVSINALINQALTTFVGTELEREERDLSRTLEALRAYRKRHADFSAAIDDVAQAEAALEYDPAEGRPVDGKPASLEEELTAVLDG